MRVFLPGWDLREASSAGVGRDDWPGRGDTTRPTIFLVCLMIRPVLITVAKHNKEQIQQTGINRSGSLGWLNWDINQPASLTRILHNKYNVGFVYNPTIMYYVLII